MRNYLPLLIMILLSTFFYGQTNDSSAVFVPTKKPNNDSTVIIQQKKTGPDKEGNFVFVNEMPSYPGGLQNLYRAIGKNIIYPKKARKKGIEGKCYIRFVITTNGSVGKIEVQKGVPNCPECDAEAVKAIKKLEKFTPGKNDGQYVPVWFQLPINFTLR